MGRVVGNSLCSESRFECFSFKFFERKSISHLVAVVVSCNIGYYVRLDLKLYVATVIDSLVAYIGIGKLDACNVGWRDYVATENNVERCNDSRREHIGDEKPLETHSTR